VVLVVLALMYKIPLVVLAVRAVTQQYLALQTLAYMVVVGLVVAMEPLALNMLAAMVRRA
jgi:positive regulator of sigma E activity